jgi:hypothetical protein
VISHWVNEFKAIRSTHNHQVAKDYREPHKRVLQSFSELRIVVEEDMRPQPVLEVNEALEAADNCQNPVLQKSQKAILPHIKG